MSDILQTSDGQRFWIDNMAQAEARGYQIAYVDKNRREVHIYNSKEDLDEWIQSFNTWGKEMKHLGERFLIFKK